MVIVHSLLYVYQRVIHNPTETDRTVFPGNESIMLPGTGSSCISWFIVPSDYRYIQRKSWYIYIYHCIRNQLNDPGSQIVYHIPIILSVPPFLSISVTVNSQVSQWNPSFLAEIQKNWAAALAFGPCTRQTGHTGLSVTILNGFALNQRGDSQGSDQSTSIGAATGYNHHLSHAMSNWV